MYIKDITKDTIFVKRIGDAYLVDEKEIDGIKTIRTTKNHMKAAHFTTEYVYSIVYNNLSEREIERLKEAYKKNDAYSLLSSYIGAKYAIISVTDIDYGYADDLVSEQTLLKAIGMEYVFNPITINIESIDSINVEEE